MDCYSLPEFFEYMKPANLAYLEIPRRFYGPHWIFWNQEHDDSQEFGRLNTSLFNQTSISEKIQQVLRNLLIRDPYPVITLTQFWAPKMRGNRRFLTSSGQPFALASLSKKMCCYRKQCMSQDIYIYGEGYEEEEEGKELLGPIGRAFLKRLPESTPNAKYYSLQEFPLRDHARLAAISNLAALPVFEDHDLKNCVGVLELAGSCSPRLHIWEQELKAVGLTRYHRPHIRPGPKVQQDLLEEIKQAVKVVADTHPLAMALVFTRSRSCGNDACCHNLSDLGLLQLAICRDSDESYDLHEFIRAHATFHLQEGKGVAGKALTSRKFYFCRNMCDFSIVEYPLVHYARSTGLNLSFAICLQVSPSENDDLILEFFFCPGNYSYCYTCSLLKSVLTKLKKQFQGSSILTEEVLGEVVSKVTNSLEDDEIDYLPVTENSTYPHRLRIWQYDSQKEGDGFKALDYTAIGNSEYSLSEFLEYVKQADLIYLLRSPGEEHDFVFWRDEKKNKSQARESLDESALNNCSITGRIKHVLHHLQEMEIMPSLTQFWSPKWRGRRCFLTTSDQPFALSILSKSYCSYRKLCMNVNIYTFEEGDEEEKQNQHRLGPVGRAFCNRQPESSPNVKYYTPKEFPQRDVALLHGIRCVTAVPVFKACEQICVGVLEFLDICHQNLLYSLREALAKALSEVGLTSNYCSSRPDFKGLQDSWKEIKQLFRTVAQTYPLAMALAFVPLRFSSNDECCHNSTDLGFLKLAFHEVILHDDLKRGHERFYLQNGKGVSGKAFASQKSYFCKNICALSIADYPFVHYAREDGLTLSFAVFLQTTQCDNDPLVLEFFLLPGNDSHEHTYSLLVSLLTTIKHHLQSFRIASEDVEEVFPQVIISSNDDEVDGMWISQNSGHSSGLQILQNDMEMNQLDSADQHVMLEGNTTNFGKHVVNVEGDASVTRTKNKVTTTKSKRQGKGKILDISYDDLKQHFGKPLDKVASILGVSRSTIKRFCRKYNIVKWPFHEKNKSNHSPFKMKHTNAPPQEGEGSGSTSSPYGRNPPCRNLSVRENVVGQVNQHGNMPRDARTVTIKASYGQLPMIKFLLSFTSKLAELEEEVAKRLKLKVGSFSMMYHDEDNDLISITCDTDLQLCMETMTSSGKSTIKMSVLLNSN